MLQWGRSKYSIESGLCKVETPSEAEIKKALEHFEVIYRADVKRLTQSGAIPESLGEVPFLYMMLAYTGTDFIPIVDKTLWVYNNLANF